MSADAARMSACATMDSDKTVGPKRSIGILLHGKPRDVDGHGERHRFQARRTGIQGRHLDADSIRKHALLSPKQYPAKGFRWRPRLAKAEAAIGQLVGQN